MEAITKEIIEEISDNRRSNKDFNQGSRSKLFGVTYGAKMDQKRQKII